MNTKENQFVLNRPVLTNDCLSFFKNRSFWLVSLAAVLLALCAPAGIAKAAGKEQAELDLLLAKVDKQLLADCQNDFRSWLDAGLTNRTGPFVPLRVGPNEWGYLKRTNDGRFDVNLQWSMAAGAAFPYFDGTLVFGDTKYRKAALEMADFFLTIQEKEGFWGCKYLVAPVRGSGGERWEIINQRNYQEKDTGEMCRFQDYFQTGPFYLMLTAYKQTSDEKYRAAAIRAADYLLLIQNDNGTWPDYWTQGYKRTGKTVTSTSGTLEGYSYNDGSTSASMRILLCAYRLSKDQKYLAKFPQLGQWLFDSQWGKGKVRGWCQQYGVDGKPTTARNFEMPLIEGRVFNRFISQMAGWFYMATGEERYIRLIKETHDWMKSVEKPGPDGGWGYQYTPDGDSVFSVGYQTYRHDQPKTWPKDFGRHKGVELFSRVKSHLGYSEELLAPWESGGLEKTRAAFRATKQSPTEVKLAAARRLVDEKNLTVVRQRFLKQYMAGAGGKEFFVSLEGMAQLDYLLSYGIATGKIQPEQLAPRNEPMWASSHGYGDVRGTPLTGDDWVPVTPINQESPFEIGWFTRAFGEDLWSGIALTPAGK